MANRHEEEGHGGGAIRHREAPPGGKTESWGGYPCSSKYYPGEQSEGRGDERRGEDDLF